MTSKRGKLTRSPWALRYMFPQLGLPDPRQRGKRELTAEEVMWSLRGEPRTRATFSQPHPDDFPGGLPDPPEYPSP